MARKCTLPPPLRCTLPHQHRYMRLLQQPLSLKVDSMVRNMVELCMELLPRLLILECKYSTVSRYSMARNRFTQLSQLMDRCKFLQLSQSTDSRCTRRSQSMVDNEIEDPVPKFGQFG